MLRSSSAYSAWKGRQSIRVRVFARKGSRAGDVERIERAGGISIRDGRGASCVMGASVEQGRRVRRGIRRRASMPGGPGAGVGSRLSCRSVLPGLREDLRAVAPAWSQLEVGLLEAHGPRARLAVADRPAVDVGDGGDAGHRVGHHDLVGAGEVEDGVEAGLDVHAGVAGHLHDRAPRDAHEDPPRAGVKRVSALDGRDVEAGALAGVAAIVEEHALVVAGVPGLQLAQHVVEVVEALDLRLQALVGELAEGEDLDPDAGSQLLRGDLVLLRAGRR